MSQSSIGAFTALYVRCRLSRFVSLLSLSTMCCTQPLRPAIDDSQRIPLARQAVRVRLVEQSGHSLGIRCVAFSPDKKRVLTGGQDYLARLWDVETGREICRFDAGTWKVESVAFSPDGTRVLIGSWGARIWDITTGRELLRFSNLPNVSTCAFSPDGTRVLTGTNSGTAHLWAIDGSAHLWEVRTEREIRTVIGPNDGVRSAAFSSDGTRVLTGSADGSVELWDVATGREIRRLEGHRESVVSVAFSLDGTRVLTGSSDGTARLWDVEIGREIGRFEGNGGWISSVAFSPDGPRLLTGSDDGLVRLWDVQTGREIRHFEGHPGGVGSLSSDAMRVLTRSRSWGHSLWDIPTGREICRLEGETRSARSAAFSADASLVLTGGGNVTSLWDVETGREVRRFEGQGWVAFSRDGRLVLTRDVDNTARLWDVHTGGQIRRFEVHDRVQSVAFSPDGARVLTGGMEGTARLWDVETGGEILRLKGHDRFWSVAFSPDGTRVLTGSVEGTARLWDVETGSEIRQFADYRGWVTSVAFSPDGRRVLTGNGDNTARLWDVETGGEIRRLAGYSGVWSVAFSPNGRFVLIGNEDGTARLWAIESGTEIRSFKGHADSVSSLAFSRDGTRVLTGSSDGTTRLFDTQSGQELCCLVSFLDGSWAVVAPDGRFDAANQGKVTGLHFVAGLEPIALSQLRDRYWEPGLLAKIMGFNDEPLRTDVEALTHVHLYPEVSLNHPTADQGRLLVTLTNRGGGIGPVVVKVNGSDAVEDARPRGPLDADAETLTIPIELTAVARDRLAPGDDNKIEVIASNAEGSLSSRPYVTSYKAAGQPGPEEVDLFILAIGATNYTGDKIDLKYPDKDAEAIGRALDLAGRRLWGPERSHMRILTSLAACPELRSNKENIAVGLKWLEQSSSYEDIVVVFLAGHGITVAAGEGSAGRDYYFLTGDAHHADADRYARDPTHLEKVSLSAKELFGALARLKSLPEQRRHVLVLDTCAAGQAGKTLASIRGPSAAMLRRMAEGCDRAGVWVLAGCAADREAYEASRYKHALLTYGLLDGMRGGARRPSGHVAVFQLFDYATKKVRRLAEGIGGIQEPEILQPLGAAASFDLGVLTVEDCALIELSPGVPVFVRSLFHDDIADTVGLGQQVDARLLHAAQVGEELEFWDFHAGHDTYMLAGRYGKTESGLEVQLALYHYEIPARVGEAGASDRELRRREVRRQRIVVPADAEAAAVRILDVVGPWVQDDRAAPRRSGP